MQDKPKEQSRVPGQTVEKATKMLNTGRAPSSTELDPRQQPEEERGRDELKASCDSELTARRRIHRLEKEKLEMMSAHNRQLCTLEAEATRLRASVEHGEARRAELQYQVTVSRRDARRACRSNEALVEQAAALQKVLHMTRQAREDERLALQQEVDERDVLVDDLTSESQRLHRLLQRQEEALEEAQRRMVTQEKEAQARKSLTADVEAQRAAHLEWMRKCQVTQAMLAVERRGQQEAQCNLERLRRELRDAERAYQDERERGRRTEQTLQCLQTEYKQSECGLSVALETEKSNAAGLAEKLEEEKRQHADTRLLLEQVRKREGHCGKLLQEVREALQQHPREGAKDDGKRSPPADVMQLLRWTLSRQEVAEQQVRHLLLDRQKLDQDKRRHSKAHLSFLHRVYQRLLAGRVFADPQSMPAEFSCSDLCDLITELVEQLTSDLQEANAKVARLQAACEDNGGLLQQLRRRHKLALARARQSARRRAALRNGRYQRTVAQLRDLVSLSRRKSASFLSACALLAGTVAHAQRRLSSLAQQKHLLASRLAAREELEEELRRLAGALGGDGGEGPAAGASARRRWRKYVCVVSTLRWWRVAGRRSMVLFRLEAGHAAPLVCVATATLMGDDIGECREALCARWLRSKRLSAAILACVADLPPPASPPTHVRSAARAGLARLLERIVSQSESAPEILHEMTPQIVPPSDLKMLASRLQRHFLLLSQRLHSAEVERRSLRLQVAHLRRTEDGGGDNCRMVPATHFASVCADLRQALTGEQEARALLQEQSTQRAALQLRLNVHAAQRDQAHRALRCMAEALAEARRRLRGKERSLRILAKHLSRVDKERRRLRHVEDATEAGGRSHIVKKKRKRGGRRADEREDNKDLRGRAPVVLVRLKKSTCPPTSRRCMRIRRVEPCAILASI